MSRMIATGEYRGVPFSIPHNDDGVWHYKIFPRRDRRLARGQPRPTAVEGYPTREAAIAAAKKAIDAWLAAVALSTGTIGDRSGF
jgi:hypothetical protein